MLTRKINAVVSLISTILLMAHALSHAAWMLSDGRIAIGSDIISWMLVGFMALHAFISIELGVSAHMDIEKRKCKNYPRMNVSTMIQRIGGVLLILFTGLHIAGTVGFLQPPEIVHAILPPLFFAMALLHVAVSFSKALITLGIGTAKAVKIVDVIVKIVCAATLIADVVGFYRYL